MLPGETIISKINHYELVDTLYSSYRRIFFLSRPSLSYIKSLMQIGLLGMNHKTAELPLREGFAALCGTLFSQKEFSSLPLVILNTCKSK